MTNTTDFRRHSYGMDTSYAIKSFNASRSSAAPSYAPTPQRKKREIGVRTNKVRKSDEVLIHEQRITFKKMLVVITTTALAIAMASAVLYTFVVKNELTHEISSVKNDISMAQSENISLNSNLESMVSVSQIDKYAIEKLGMTRLQASQIKYIDANKYKEERLSSLNNQSPAEIAKNVK